MQQSRVWLVALSMVGLVTAGLAFTSAKAPEARAAEPQGPPGPVGPRPQPVLVTNDVSQAVPISAVGTTAVSGGVRASQEGLWRVALDGTPGVFITNEDPILVRLDGLDLGVAPRSYADMLDVQSVSPLSGTCEGFEHMYAFDRQVVGNTTHAFSVPPDKVWVVTGFDWHVSQGVANASRTAQLYRFAVGVNGPSANSTGMSDAAGRAGGSATFTTGLTIEPGITLCIRMTDHSSEFFEAVAHGYLIDR